MDRLILGLDAFIPARASVYMQPRYCYSGVVLPSGTIASDELYCAQNPLEGNTSAYLGVN